MSKEYELRVEAQRFIHNDLANCSYDFSERTREKYEKSDTDGVYHDMMASLVFCAFSVEAKVNYLGWKLLKDDWNERDSFKQKVNKVKDVTGAEVSWGNAPLQTIHKLMKFRDTLAHGKPEVVDFSKTVQNTTDVREALKSQWESTVTREFVSRCLKDTDELWRILVEAAKIEVTDTMPSATQTLRLLVEPDRS